MKHLQTFESLFKRKKRYLVTYKVTNVNALPSRYTKDGKEPEKVLKEWDSDVYEYVIPAKSEDGAKNVFTFLWNKEASRLEPTPKLTVLSVREAEHEDISRTAMNEMEMS